ncbi:GNAT family N-acetyltransferase [Azospirillum sp.]|uniref:GNAT family N-acetyltransferase n=1 Tax=Azospirillum sp. TaxID=34012 RepID=UPI002D721784|nr:GNAT family N-acetyltransferase [Azospirillum sp.]HYD70516.1 GNAT family N-acetyltransferase [Azospirillum sp.]
MPFRFRRPTLEDAPLLLDWRTRPDITRYMYTDMTQDLDRQRDWLKACETRNDFKHFIIEAEGEPAGYLNYAEIDRTHRRCSSGSYLTDSSRVRRLAGFLYPFILDYCFFGMTMHKLVNTFLEGNDKVIRLQRLLRFREVGVFRQHIHKYGRWHDVTVFEMLCEEWEARPRLFPVEHTLAAFEE